MSFFLNAAKNDEWKTEKVAWSRPPDPSFIFYLFHSFMVTHQNDEINIVYVAYKLGQTDHSSLISPNFHLDEQLMQEKNIEFEEADTSWKR